MRFSLHAAAETLNLRRYIYRCRATGEYAEDRHKLSIEINR